MSIEDRVLTYQSGPLQGELIEPGFNEFGYNYQAHKFKDYYLNWILAGLSSEPYYPPYEGDEVTYLAENPTISTDSRTKNAWNNFRNVLYSLKWDDEWLSNKDCDKNGRLDRPVFQSGIGYLLQGTDASVTDRLHGVTPAGCDIDILYKLIAVPDDAVFELVGPDPRIGNWYAADGTLIGPTAKVGIYGKYMAEILLINDNSCDGTHGIVFKSDYNPKKCDHNGHGDK